MPSKLDELADSPPTEINPYKVLGLEPNVSEADIKSTYKKLALKHHPDKVHPSARADAHITFQNIAFAYAILSDSRRRKRYDTTGNTSESLGLDDDDFNWGDFFREQWADAVTRDSLNSFKSIYQGSEEEKGDLLRYFKSSKGNMNAVFRNVMLSNPLDDEERFRAIIDAAIENGEVEGYSAYVKESKTKKQQRMAWARTQEAEAQLHAKKTGVYESLFGDGTMGKNAKKGDDADLAALIQDRSKGRAASFLENLEAKYAGGANGSTKTKKGKKRGREEEPPEEAFQKMAAKQTKQKKSKTKPKVTEDDDDDVEEDLEELDSEAFVEKDESEMEEKTKKTYPLSRSRNRVKKGRGAKKSRA